MFATFCHLPVKADVDFTERLRQLLDNARLQVVIQAHNKASNTYMRRLKCCLSLRVSSCNEAPECRALKLREWVVVLNKPAYSCHSKALSIETKELVSSSLRYLAAVLLKHAL
jgi:hypothetical protein